MRDSVPSVRYSSVCNVFLQRRIWLIYRVYRLYDIDSMKIMIMVDNNYARYDYERHMNVTCIGISHLMNTTCYFLPLAVVCLPNTSALRGH